MFAPQGTKPVKLLMSMTGAGGVDAGSVDVSEKRMLWPHEFGECPS